MMTERRRITTALIPGLITAATAAVVVCALQPIVVAAPAKSQTEACLSNLKRIGLAMQAYLQDYDGTYPVSRRAVTGGTWTWKRALFPYVREYDVFKCPSVQNYWARNSGTGSLGDESNMLPRYRTDRSQWMPASYAYSGGFFFETGTGGSERPRKDIEIKDRSQVLLIINTRMNYPDIGPWMMSVRCNLQGDQVAVNSDFGAFVGHQHRIAVCMADGHAVAEKLINTVQPVDQWQCSRTGYTTQAQLLAIAATMANEYK